MLSLKNDKETLADLNSMKLTDFLAVLEGVVSKIGKGVTHFMVEWNEPDANRKELANTLNERMHEPTEYLTLLTLMLKVMQREPDMPYDRVMVAAFNLRNELDSTRCEEDFIKKMQEIKNGKH